MMNRTTTQRLVTGLLAGMLTLGSASAATLLWQGGGDLLWSTAGNWNPNGQPTVADAVVFGTAATTANNTTVNNTVDGVQTIGSLTYTNTGAVWHVTQIPASSSLTVTGAVTIGGLALGSVTSYVAVVDGGTFLATGSPFNVGNGNNANGSRAPGILDLSGLTNFSYIATGGTLGLATAGSRADGTITLASGSNNITAATINIAGASGTSSSPIFNFGAGTNVINVNTFNAGAQRATTTVQFAGGTGGLRLRGTGGTDTNRTTMVVGNRNTGGTLNLTTTGNVLLNGHPVDMKFSTLTLGLMSRTQGGTDTGKYIAVGNFFFDQGIVDANTVTMGVCSGASTNSAGVGNLTVGAAGTLVAGTISLANVSSASSGVSGIGALTNAGGTIICNGDLIKTTGGTASTGIVSVTTGTLKVGGSFGTGANPINALVLSDATVTLRAAVTAPANVTALTTGGTTNIINIGAIAAITSYPAQFQVVKYGSLAGAGFDNNIGLGTLPEADTPFQGYLTNNTDSLSIDLVVTSGPAPAQAITWTGTESGAWDKTTRNWLVGTTATNYNNIGDYVTFDDTASTSTVYLVTSSLTPGSVTVNNAALTYTFTGSGKLSGATGLTKQGLGTLVLDNSGINDFAGPIALTGTLQVGTGGTSGNLPALTSISNEGTLVVNRSDNFTMANPINGSGAFVKNGANTLTLGTSNSFTGSLTANSGVLRFSALTASSTGPLTVNAGATVVMNGLHKNSSILLAGGVLGSSGNLTALTNDLTLATGTESTIFMADPQNLAPTDGYEMVWINSLSGNGSLTIATVTNDLAADAGNGFRFRGTNASTFSGTITVSNNVKAEIQTGVAGPFSPIGTGKFRLWCGGFFATNNLQGPTIGGYTELNLRNTGTGDTVFGNDVELLGTGITFLDPLGAAPAGTKVTMGNLKMGGGQELGIYLGAAPAHVVVFPTVTLTGGDARFSPKTIGFGATSAEGSDLALGNITETAPSGIIMNGLRTLTLSGNNNYSGSTVVSNGTLVIDGANLGAGSLTVYGGTLGGTGAVSGPVSVVAGTLSPGLGAIGTMSVGNTLTLAGTNTMGLNKSGTTLTNDRINGITTLTLGGTLVLNLSGDALAAGDSFKLYSFTSATGEFANIIPATPGVDLLWGTNKLASEGVLEVLSAVKPQPYIQTISISGTDVVISGTNTVSGGSYYVLSTTNVALPLSSWTPLATQSFEGFTFSYTNAITPGETQRYYLLQVP